MVSIEAQAAEFDRVFNKKAAGGCRYYTANDSAAKTVVLLPGGLGIGISWVRLALALVPDYRVLTVDYPPSAKTFADLAASILGVLDAEDLRAVNLVGQSAGGMLTEALVQRAPERVASIMFTGSGLYGPEDVERLSGKLAGVRQTPWEQTQAAASTALRTAWSQSPEADFWIGQAEAAYREMGKEGVENSLALMLSLAETVEPLQPGWHGKVLIVAAAADPMMTDQHRQRLIDLHPGCEVKVFPSGGHSLLLTRPDDYIALVEQHLEAASGKLAT